MNTFTYVGKEGRTIQLPYQVKNAIDHSIKTNEALKKKTERENKGKLLERIDRGFSEWKAGNTFMPKAPRK